MKVLMLGWEFPPLISGGLGTACYGLTKGLTELGTQVLFVLPRPVESSFSTHVKLLRPEHATRSGNLPTVDLRTLDVKMYPYANPGKPLVPVAQVTEQTTSSGVTVGGSSKTQLSTEEHYGQGLFAQIQRYAHLVCQIASQESFDVIHAHDWMTYPAAVAAAKLTGKPLVAHIHSTEFDRSGEHINQSIYNIERQGMHLADRIIAVSNLTKRVSTTRYDVPEEKVDVVYNAVNSFTFNSTHQPRQKDEKIVLFLGRITMQKGPEYFLAAAKKVLEKLPNVKFIMAGAGDMDTRMVTQAAQMGIGQRIFFTGFLHGQDVARAYRMADVYIMPSVSEPFGITPLEAMANDVPVIISKQSGIAEILRNALKVDFWDINEMANKIISVLIHPPLQSMLRENGAIEARKFSWVDSARKCVDIYRTLTLRAANLRTSRFSSAT